MPAIASILLIVLSCFLAGQVQNQLHHLYSTKPPVRSARGTGSKTARRTLGSFRRTEQNEEIGDTRIFRPASDTTTQHVWKVSFMGLLETSWTTQATNAREALRFQLVPVSTAGRFH